MKVFIKTIDGNKFIIETELHNTVSWLKDKLKN